MTGNKCRVAGINHIRVNGCRRGRFGGAFGCHDSRVSDARLGAVQRERCDQAGHVAHRDDVIVRREGHRDALRFQLRVAQADELVGLVRDIGLGASGGSLLVCVGSRRDIQAPEKNVSLTTLT